MAYNNEPTSKIIVHGGASIELHAGKNGVAANGSIEYVLVRHFCDRGDGGANTALAQVPYEG